MSHFPSCDRIESLSPPVSCKSPVIVNIPDTTYNMRIKMDKVRLKATRPSYILFAYGLMPIYISLFKFGRTNLTMEVINKNFSYGAFHK